MRWSTQEGCNNEKDNKTNITNWKWKHMILRGEDHYACRQNLGIPPRGPHDIIGSLPQAEQSMPEWAERVYNTPASTKP
jgi:hypothetical protein